MAPSTRSSSAIPRTPRVISPSPTPSELQDRSKDGYFAPVTRSSTRKRVDASPTIDENNTEENLDESAELGRARTRSRSPITTRRANGVAPLKPVMNKLASADTNGKLSPNTLLSPGSAEPPGWSWRDISRSPSPSAILIPIHRHFRSFIHKHEVPRKFLHVSIGFFTLYLYRSGVQVSSITPYLMTALVPIATVDYLRHTYPALNRIYVRFLGALMRETEYDGWNGVIWYLLGAWIVLGFFPKDVGVMGVLLLSWCDTAASTVGRAWGRKTYRLRRGKSLAGSLAAFTVGVFTALFFWGWLAPRTGPFEGDVDWPFMYKGTLSLPAPISNALGLTEDQATIGGIWSLGLMSLWTGFIASASELVDLFGWDDNLTIPVLSGIGIWGVLKVFG